MSAFSMAMSIGHSANWLFSGKAPCDIFSLLRLWAHVETILHLMWNCNASKVLLDHITALLRARFPSAFFGKHFWLFGILTPALRQYRAFFDWLRYWAMWTIWYSRNRAVFGESPIQAFQYFKESLHQSLYDCLSLQEIDLSLYSLFTDIF